MPRLDKAGLIAEALGVSLDWLVFGDRGSELPPEVERVAANEPILRAFGRILQRNFRLEITEEQWVTLLRPVATILRELREGSNPDEDAEAPARLQRRFMQLLDENLRLAQEMRAIGDALARLSVEEGAPQDSLQLAAEDIRKRLRDTY